MEITRNGEKFVLTEDELFKAYLEQRALNDIEVIEQELKGYVSSEEYLQLAGNQEFLKKAACLLRIYMDKYDMEESYAIREAIKAAMLSEGGLKHA